jgi:hypothetical protein
LDGAEGSTTGRDGTKTSNRTEGTAAAGVRKVKRDGGEWKRPEMLMIERRDVESQRAAEDGGEKNGKRRS